MNTLSKKIAFLVVISLLLGCSNRNESIKRRGDIICEFRIGVSSTHRDRFANDINDIGDQFGLAFLEDVATEKATAEHTDRAVKIMYLVKKYESDQILVLAANNVSDDDVFFVQVYAGAISKPVGDGLCKKAKTMQRDFSS